MSQEGARHRAGLWLRQAEDDLRAAPAVRWQRQARVLDKLDAPTRYPDALADDLPADVFGPEDAAAPPLCDLSRKRCSWKTLAGLACGKEVRR
jgi:hypothetical protein